MPNTTTSQPWLILAGSLVCYLLVLTTNGYVFGADDQVEILPYALYLQNPELYPGDFYIQYISTEIPNERYLFSKLLSFGAGHLALVCGVLHLVFSLGLFWGLYRLGSIFLRSEILRWVLVLAVCCPPLYGINLGGNELYYNLFIASLASKAFGIWAIYFFLRDRFNVSFILLITSTLLHPVVGAQLFILLSGVLVLGKYFRDLSLSWAKIFRYLFAYLLTAGAWVVFLKLNFDKGSIDKALLFEILEFRVPHHYFPAYFPRKNYLLLTPLFGFGLFYFFKKNRKLFWFFAIAIAGAVFYTLAVEWLQISAVMTSQWFKTTIWLKAFSLLAVLAFLESRLAFLRRRQFNRLAFYGLVALSLLGIFIMARPFSVFRHKPYDFFFTSTDADPAIDIARQAKAKTPQEALFVIPFDQTAFKYFSHRSCYIDYKTVVHRKDALPVWYQRVKEIYGVDLKNRRAGDDLTALANAHYSTRNTAEWRRQSEHKFGYLLTYRENSLDFPVVAENGVYRIYRID